MLLKVERWLRYTCLLKLLFQLLASGMRLYQSHFLKCLTSGKTKVRIIDKKQINPPQLFVEGDFPSINVLGQGWASLLRHTLSQVCFPLSKSSSSYKAIIHSQLDSFIQHTQNEKKKLGFSLEMVPDKSLPGPLKTQWTFRQVIIIKM